MDNQNQNELNHDENKIESKQDDVHIDETIELKPKRKYKLKKNYRNKFLIFSSIFIVCIYFGGFIYYNNLFLSHTFINGFDVAGLSIEKATLKIEKGINDHTLTLSFIDGKEETVNKDVCGVSLNPNNDIQKEYNKQNKWLWFTNFFTDTHIDIENLVTVDNTKLTQAINSLNHVKQKQEAPVDAIVQYVNNQFSIKDEVFGSTIDKSSIEKIILKAFNYGEANIEIKKAGGYVEPQKTSKDPSILNLLEASKKYATAVITYQSTTGDIVLDGNTIATWLSVDEKGNYYRDDAEFKKQADAFVKEKLVPKINIVGKSKTFVGAGNRRLSVSGGNYGYKVNQEKEVEGLLEDIYAGKEITRTPITTGVQASYSNGGLGDTFVEIDMSAQHFWFHKNGQIIVESDIVTGLPSDPSRKTPGGTYYIYFMQRDRVLRGTKKPDGTWPYESPVSFWMAFNKGIGLHDATWQPKFGGNIYKTKGSHGCINLPYSAAKKLYGVLKNNTPVVCYY